MEVSVHLKGPATLLPETGGYVGSRPGLDILQR